MAGEVQAFINGFPVAAISGAAALAILILGVAVYVLMTPHKEMKLVMAGNSSAGLALAGIMVGLALPLAAALKSSLGLVELVLWGIVAVLVQLIAFRVVDWLLRGLRRRIVEDQAGAAIVLVGANLAVALVIAAAVTDPHLSVG